MAFTAVETSAALAQGFARIVFRNAINIALPVMVCPGIHTGVVKNQTTGIPLQAEAVPPNIQHILKSGGLVEVTRQKLAAASGVRA